MYDLIVIGDDLSAHVAAAYASQKNLHTLLVAEGGLGGLQLIGDFVFNVDPTPLSGLGQEQLGLSVLAELGIAPPEAHTLSINPAYQVILPDHRIDFFGDLNQLTAELAREFPEAETDIGEYYRIALDTSSVIEEWMAEHPLLQPQTLKEYFAYLKIFPYIFRYKFGAARFDKILSEDESLEKIWEAQQALLSFNIDDMFSLASAFQYCTPLRGVSYFPQGKQFLFNALIEKLESHKGGYLSNCQISSISRPGTIDLEIKGKDGTISKVSGYNLIISTKSDKLSLLKLRKKHLNFSDWIRPAEVVYYPFTIFLGVDGKCLPEQIARHIALVTDVTKDIYDNNLIILETGLPEKNESLAQGRISLSATVYLAANEENWAWDALKNQADAILRRLEEFLPFLRENIELGNVDRSIDLSLEYRKVLSPKYKVRNAFWTSFAAKSNKTRFNNIFLTGTSLMTDAGFDGEIISGRNAVLQMMNQRK